MKINLEQLAAQLQKKLAPIYLITGDEILLVQEAAAMVRKAVQQAGFQERKLFQVETGFNWEELLLEANSLSLFSQRTLLEMTLPENKLTEAAKKTLESYSVNPPSDKILLITTTKLDSKTYQANWLKVLMEQGVVVTIWALDMSQLLRWINQRLQKYGLSADNAGMQLLAERTEGNLLATQQAIEKLSLLYNNTKLTAENIAVAISDSSRFDMFQLVDAVLLGDGKRILRVLSGLKEEGSEPTLILWALTRQLRQLISIVNAAKQGQTLEQIFLQQKIWDKQKPFIKKSLSRCSKANYQKWLLQAEKIDRCIKGAASGNVWDELTTLSFNMAGLSLITA